MNLSEKEQDQVWPCPWSCQNQAGTFGHSRCALGGHLATPFQQPDGNVEAEGHLPLVLLLFLVFLFRTATIEDPASHFPDIFSETLCWPAKPSGSILPWRIPSARFLFLKDKEREWEQRAAGRLSSATGSVGSQAALGLGRIACSGGHWSYSEALGKVSGLGVGSSRHHSQKTPLTRVHPRCSPAADRTAQQDPWVMTEPGGASELLVFGSDRKRLGEKSLMISEDEELLLVSVRIE